ncbi:hypothetical protein BpHYR1_044591 [Brachionus plicatilis]|uniref:Uncharacterized protein n=1 Tax=Brachionus plicatilis TaxID=10195 RepID=A0A3M7Q072_BRAPC|nr:hypothetical protein BpHYR1_044591 [Brachionus plicatilis]
MTTNLGSEVDPCEEQDLSEEESVEKSESVTEETGSLTNLQIFKSAALAKQVVSEETKLAVKKSLCKFSDPTPCPLCGELMKNDKVVKLHIKQLMRCPLSKEVFHFSRESQTTSGKKNTSFCEQLKR